MWIWWVISLVILIACFIFAYRMIISSFDYLPEDKKDLQVFRNSYHKEKVSANEEVIWDLRKKLQRVEENASFYEIQFTKLQQRLRTLEQQQTNQKNAKFEEGENWKDLYYEENGTKEKLENELDATLQKLESAEKKLNFIEENKSSSAALQSEYDARLNDITSMQNHIGLLQRKLEASVNREKELEQMLIAENHIKNQYEQIKRDYTQLQIEDEGLRKQIVKMEKREHEVEKNISRLNELESKLYVYEEEKSKMISNLEQMIRQNKTLSATKNS